MFGRIRYVIAVVVVAFAVSPAGSALQGEDWPQWRGKNRDGVWTETGIIEKLPAGRLTPKWTVPIGSGYCGPTVAKGRVYVMDRVARPDELERVHCFDELSGKTVWSHQYPCEYGGIGYPAGPRASVTVHEAKAYALGSTGRLHVFDAVSGRVLWHKDLDAQYSIEMPIWGIAASPLIHGNLVILHIGGQGARVIALNKDTGEEVWRALNDKAQYSAPIVVQQAGQPVVIVWTGDSVSGLAPSTGKILWQYEWKVRKMPIGVATPVVEKDRVFFTSFYDGSLMLRLASDRPHAEKVWQIVGQNEQNTLALHSIISTPVFENGYIYGVDSYGELRCLDANTGDRIWEDKTATPPARWSTIHFVKNGDKHWLFNERGELLIAKLSPQGFQEISRTKLLEPTTDQLSKRGGVCWSHPAFANKHIFARNDKELVCANLAAE